MPQQLDELWARRPLGPVDGMKMDEVLADRLGEMGGGETALCATTSSAKGGG